MIESKSCSSTDWIKLTKDKRSSKIKLKNGKLIYKTYYDKELKAKIHARSRNDKHKNNYLSVGSDYVHRLKAKAVCAAIGRSLDGSYKIHHRLIDETATVKGNSLQYLVVLSDKDHTRLHYLLKLLAAYVQGSIESYQLNLNV
ncbi:hypothetical protein [Ligilactobacillus salivarius]|uniref:hypothetical protein n=1 Tax=Ligilactobacillus salivarius TaxID=1624 RepID=UPI000BAF3A7D|nr:hypothetical protein [Ligilactobacillus salivarius]MBE7388264.1 hypothetical protein [Ligilactobacillus salivarius]MBE7392818.1 hypothetical protein [Ligilactobacillus salivarius]PAY39430.1 hypothetical protein A8C39_10245 [Ligilactobacillus salivarius]PAY59477.1 hypothetical protein A8C41_10540 [Ligilactobacillus salivarius]